MEVNNSVEPVSAADGEGEGDNTLSTTNSPATTEKVKKFMLEVLPMLDELDYVERYAWFTCRDDNLALHTSQLIKDDGTLTELGKVYAAHKSK